MSYFGPAVEKDNWSTQAIQWLRGDPSLSADDEYFLVRLARQRERGVRLAPDDIIDLHTLVTAYGFWTNEPVKPTDWMDDLDLAYDE